MGKINLSPLFYAPEWRAAAGMEDRPIIIKLKGLLFAWVLRLERLTWRVHIKGREHLDRLYSSKKRFLLCFWHGKYTPIFPLLEGYEVCVISSRSERGSVIAEICRNFGYRSAQIPDQPGREVLPLLEKVLSAARGGGIAVDGPLGPRHRVKTGVIRMASALGFALVPVSVDSRRKMVWNKRWDRMEIPLPFATVGLVLGEPIQVPPGLQKEQIRDWANHLSEVLTKLDQEAEDRVRKARPLT